GRHAAREVMDNSILMAKHDHAFSFTNQAPGANCRVAVARSRIAGYSARLPMLLLPLWVSAEGQERRCAAGRQSGVPMLTKPFLKEVLDNDALTRGLGDPEARVLVEWL